MVIARILGFIVERTGLRARLQKIWRRDIARSAAATDRSTVKAVKELERLLEEGRQQQRTAEGRLRELENRLAQSDVAAPNFETRLTKLEHASVVNNRQARLVADWQARFSPSDICAHVTRAVSEASLHEKPGIHLRVDQLFPPDFYELLLASLPATEFFGPGDSLEMNLRPEQDGVVPRLTSLLSEFLDNEVAHAMTGAALRRLGPFIRGRYERLFGSEYLETVFALPHGPSGGRLIGRRPGCREKPHCAPKEASATVFIHLASSGDPETPGTALYSIDGDFLPVRTGTSYPEAHGLTCTLVSCVPFRPNSALILGNAGAAHGAQIVDDTGASDRLQYAFQFHIGPNVPRLLDFVSTLPPADQQQWLGLARRRDT